MYLDGSRVENDETCDTCGFGVRVDSLLGVGADGSSGGIDWLIVGGESGAGARPCDVAWIRSAMEQCRAADVPIFVKQLGAAPFVTDSKAAAPYPLRSDARGGRWEIRLQSRKGADPSEWPPGLHVRQMPEVRRG